MLDVAILGDGPMGALLANLLGQAGLRVGVFERECEIYNLPIDASIPDIGYGEVAANSLHMPQYSGKLVIVRWHHGNLPDLTLDLGVPKTQIRGTQGMDGTHWETNIFNFFWSVKFPGGAPTLVVTAQPPV